MVKQILFSLLVILLLSSCGYTSRKGLASYYADSYEGKTTANGEIYRQGKITAAHKTLPFGTKVEVTNLSNNKSVVVRINDRGPYIRGRIIDLTKAAAREINMVGAGVAKVKIRYKRK
ncbi:MAG: septal ring lytic transglycosylase RlpA family protein [Burkholderiaceae bacterium]